MKKERGVGTRVCNGGGGENFESVMDLGGRGLVVVVGFREVVGRLVHRYGMKVQKDHTLSLCLWAST